MAPPGGTNSDDDMPASPSLHRTTDVVYGTTLTNQTLIRRGNTFLLLTPGMPERRLEPGEVERIQDALPSTPSPAAPPSSSTRRSRP